MEIEIECVCLDDVCGGDGWFGEVE
jgi:hypothetical protein